MNKEGEFIDYMQRTHLVQIRLAVFDDRFGTYWGKPIYGGVYGSGEWALVGDVCMDCSLPTIRYGVFHIRSGVPISLQHETKSSALAAGRETLRTVSHSTLRRSIADEIEKAKALDQKIAKNKERAHQEFVAEQRRRVAELPVSKREKAGYVYLVRCDQRYKIGKATDVANRLRSMMLPSKPEIIATGHFDNPHEIERKLHDAYSHCRENGEWFLLTAENVATIKTLLDQAEPKLRAVK